MALDEEIFKTVDTDGNGALDAEEFQSLMRQMSPALKQPLQALTPTKMGKSVLRK